MSVLLLLTGPAFARIPVEVQRPFVFEPDMRSGEFVIKPSEALPFPEHSGEFVIKPETLPFPDMHSGEFVFEPSEALPFPEHSGEFVIKPETLPFPDMHSGEFLFEPDMHSGEFGFIKPDMHSGEFIIKPTKLFPQKAPRQAGEVEVQRPYRLLDGKFPISKGQQDVPPAKRPGTKGPGRKKGPKRGSGPRDGKAQMGEMNLVEAMQQPQYAVDHALEPGFKDYISNGVSIYGGSRDERMRRMRYFVWNWGNGRPANWESDEVYTVPGGGSRKSYGAEIVDLYDGTLIPDSFNRNLRTKLFIHGFQQAMPVIAREIIDGHIKRGDADRYNFIGLDWRDAAEWQQGWIPGNGYNIAADNTFYVGHRVADNLIRFMESNFGFDDKSYWDKIQVVAHSLGGHVAGVAARVVKEKIGVHMPYLTSLDTAGPKFVDDSNSHFALRLTDFKYHEAIHTNGGINRPFLVRARLGNNRSDYAHASYYFNGGEHQPGCNPSGGGCSHARSYQYYAEAIGNQCAFLSRRCTLSPGSNGWGSLAERGCLDKEWTDQGPWLTDGLVSEEWAWARSFGTFLVMTNPSSPFTMPGWGLSTCDI